MRRFGKRKTVPETGYARPEQVTPFTVLAVLKRIADDKSDLFTTDENNELAATIAALETEYFSREQVVPVSADQSGNGDLDEVLDAWLPRRPK